MARRTISITLGQGAEPFDLEIIDPKSGKRYVLHGAFVSRSRIIGGAPVPLSSSTVELKIEGAFVESFDLREEQSAANQTNPPNEPPPKGRPRRPPESYRRSYRYGFDGFGPFSTKSEPAGYSQEEHDEAERVRAAERERERAEEAERRAERERERERYRRAAEARHAPDDGWPEDMGGPRHHGHAHEPFRVEDFWKWVRDAAARGAGDPPPKQRTRTHYVEGWRTLLGMPETLKDAEKAFRKLALERHPDRGGTHEQMVELNAAMKAAREVLR